MEQRRLGNWPRFAGKDQLTFDCFILSRLIIALNQKSNFHDLFPFAFIHLNIRHKSTNTKSQLKNIMQFRTFWRQIRLMKACTDKEMVQEMVVYINKVNIITNL